MRRYGAAQILAKVPGTFGNMSVLAKRLGCGRNTLYEYCRRFPSIRAAMEEEREKLIDMAEGKLATLVNDGDFNAIRFVLERQGRARGWGQEQTVNLNAQAIPQPVFRFVRTGADGDSSE